MTLLTVPVRRGGGGGQRPACVLSSRWSDWGSAISKFDFALLGNERQRVIGRHKDKFFFFFFYLSLNGGNISLYFIKNF